MLLFVFVLRRWLVDNENDICDVVRGTTLGLPLDIDYAELKQKALDGEVDWVPPAFTYQDGKRVRAATRVIRVFNLQYIKTSVQEGTFVKSEGASREQASA